MCARAYTRPPLLIREERKGRKEGEERKGKKGRGRKEGEERKGKKGRKEGREGKEQ
jgi:hypothetical protein